MADKLALDLPLLLPDALDGRDGCVARLVSSLDRQPGLDEVHVVEATETDPARLCLHYDPAATDLEDIRRLAEAAGAHLTGRYQHVMWPLRRKLPERRVADVRRRLAAVPGVAELTVTSTMVRAEVDSEHGGLELLRDAARAAGLDAPALDRSGPGALDGDGGEPHGSAAGGDHASDHEDHDDHDHGAHHHGGPFGERSELVCSVAATVLWVAGLVIDLVSDGLDGLTTGMFVAAFVLAGWFTAREAIEKVRAHHFEIDFLMLVAGAGAAAIGHWQEAALLLVLFGLGHALEGYAMGRARRAISSLAELAPDTAVLREGDREVLVGDLRPGDVIVVRPSARIAADGFVVAGASSVDQAALTGESVPVDKAAVPDAARAMAEPDGIAASGRVYAGTINGSGRLEVQVLRRAGESTLAKVAAMVRDAEAEPSPTQRFTDRFQRIFVPAVLLLVVATFAVGFGAGWGWRDAFYRAMAVLVAASPCALGLAIPSAVLAAIARAGQSGVLVKGGAALQHLGNVRAVAFDKTGTLTEGRPRLVDVRPAPGVDETVLLGTAVALERHSDHPLAAAVVRDGGGRMPVQPEEATAVTALSGRGIVGTIGSDAVVIGNPALFSERGGLDPATQAVVDELERAGRTLVIVQRAGRTLGVLGILDTPRAGAQQAIAALAATGVRRTVMLSGDHQAAADAIAGEVGVDEAWGDLLPADKVTAVDRLRVAHGTVAMIGDGVNDAPALAHASVGIAMGAAGSDVALETADVALMGDDLAKLPFAFGLGRRAANVIRQNLVASLGIVVVLLVATVTGVAGIGPAVVLHEGSTLLVVANALRLLAYRGPRTAR
jgi:Cd2+/Zn2+-exporting ATPase